MPEGADSNEFARLFNVGEAGLWFVIALVLLWRLRPPLRLASTRWRWLLPLCFALFGVSDLIESETGAWWRPGWLLLMKSGCVLGFLLAWRAHRGGRV